MDKQSLSRPVFDADGVPTIEVEDHVETCEGRLNMSGDSAVSSASGVSSTFDLPADIVSLCSFYGDSCRIPWALLRVYMLVVG